MLIARSPPQAPLLSDNYVAHFHFLGSMLGKVSLLALSPGYPPLRDL